MQQVTTIWTAIAMAIVVVGSVVGVAAAAGAGPATDGSTSLTASSDDGTAVWTDPTTIADGVDVADLSDVDDRGHLHVAYATRDAVRYATVTHHGEVLNRATVAPVSGDVVDVHVVVQPDGTAHVLWVEREPVAGRDRFERAIVRDGGDDVETHTIRTLENFEYDLSVTDAAIDRWNRVIATTTVSPGDPSADEPGRIEATTYLFVGEGQGHRTESIASHDGWHIDAALDVRGDRLVVSTSSLDAIYRGYVARALVSEYELDANGVEKIRTTVLDEAERGGSPDPDRGHFDAHSVAIRSDGAALVSVTADAWRDDPRGDAYLVLGGPTGETRVGVDAAIWSAEDRVFYARAAGQSYDVRDRDLDVVRRSGTVRGIEAWGLNAEGNPAMIRLVDGTVLYQSLVTEGVEEVLGPYDRIDSVDAALLERIAELEAELEGSGVAIEVTVEPEGAASFEVGAAALVTVESEEVPASEVTIEYEGEQYVPSGGDVRIPLESAGSQELHVAYGGEVESVTLDVAEATTGDAGDDGTTVGVPGFGFAVGVLALVVGFSLTHRHGDGPDWSSVFPRN